MLQEENYSDRKMVVGELTVVGKATGGAFTEISKNIESLQNSQSAAREEQKDYWGALSDDGIISSVEKKQLKKEWEQIEQVHTAVMNTADKKGMLQTEEVLAYDNAYLRLKTYLFTDLKLFDEMASSTTIESAEAFNRYYSRYYFALENAQIRVNVGDPGRIRTLTSLQEEGTDGEVAIYDDMFYAYNLKDHEWVSIQVASKMGEYKGVITESPPQVINQYFLVGPQGIISDYLEFILEDGTHVEWVDENENLIYINVGFEPGFIYYWSEDNEFVKVENKNNWRYVVAINDMIESGYDISPVFKRYILGQLSDEISKEVIEDTLERIPTYLGAKTILPTADECVDGDWITWAAASSETLIKGHVYVFQGYSLQWVELDPHTEDGIARDKMMRSLSDILKLNAVNDGYFNTVFCDAFFANTATIDNLRTSKIELTGDGYIRSDGYIHNVKGFNLPADGRATLAQVELTGYASADALNTVEAKADAAQNTADAAQNTADTAATDASAAKTDAGNVNTRLTNVVSGSEKFSKFSAEVKKEASGKENFVLYTEGSALDSEGKPVGVTCGFTNKGRLIASDAFIHGIIQATGGYFENAEIKGTIEAATARFNNGEFVDVNVSGDVTAKNLNIASIAGNKVNSRSYSSDVKQLLERTFTMPCTGKVRIFHQASGILSSDQTNDNYIRVYINGILAYGYRGAQVMTQYSDIDVKVGDEVKIAAYLTPQDSRAGAVVFYNVNMGIGVGENIGYLKYMLEQQAIVTDLIEREKRHFDKFYELWGIVKGRHGSDFNNRQDPVY